MKFIESLTAIGITRAEAFQCAAGRGSLELTSAKAKRVREITAVNGIPPTAFSLVEA